MCYYPSLSYLIIGINEIFYGQELTVEGEYFYIEASHCEVLTKIMKLGKM
jgi:hypothetical protein